MSKTITVKGVGSVVSKPDYVMITMNLSSRNMDYSESVDEANRRIGLLQDALAGKGYSKDDLKTLNFTTSSEYEYNKGNKRIFAGYNCRYDLKLAFDFSAERLAETLTAIADSGADTEFSIKFTVKDPEKVQEEMLVSAAENARVKAEILCKAAGKKLGELISINYNWGEIDVFSNSSYELAECRCFGAGVPEFTPDDIKSSDSAAFVWEII